MRLTPGMRLGSYEGSTSWASGGWARSTGPVIATLDSHRARFEREALAISALSHPRICTLYDMGEHAGTPFLVMEHLTGETLATHLRKGPLALQRAIQVGVEIAEGLSAAHRQGIVHRDLRPSNVMLTRSGVKLLDLRDRENGRGRENAQCRSRPRARRPVRVLADLARVQGPLPLSARARRGPRVRRMYIFLV